MIYIKKPDGNEFWGYSFNGWTFAIPLESDEFPIQTEKIEDVVKINPDAS